jgi:hypothetical protein
MFIEAIDRFVLLILVESFDLHCLNFHFIIQLHYLTRKRFKHTQQIYKTSQYYFKYSNNNFYLETFVFVTEKLRENEGKRFFNLKTIQDLIEFLHTRKIRYITKQKGNINNDLYGLGK